MNGLDPRQWATCRAALKLWAQMAKRGSTHPSRVPGVGEELGGHTPLTIREVEALLDDPPVQFELDTITLAATRHQVDRRKLRLAVYRLKIKPLVKHSENLYRRDALDRAAKYLAYQGNKWLTT